MTAQLPGPAMRLVAVALAELEPVALHRLRQPQRATQGADGDLQLVLDAARRLDVRHAEAGDGQLAVFLDLEPTVIDEVRTGTYNREKENN